MNKETINSFNPEVLSMEQVLEEWLKTSETVTSKEIETQKYNILDKIESILSFEKNETDMKREIALAHTLEENLKEHWINITIDIKAIQEEYSQPFSTAWVN